MSTLAKRVDALERVDSAGARGIVCVYYPDGRVLCNGRIYADARAIEQRAGGDTVIYRIPDNGRGEA